MQPSDEALRDLFQATRNIAVVGLSNNRQRASNGVSRYLQRAGFRVIPVNPNESGVLGEKAYATLSDIPDDIAIVDIFRKPEAVSAAVDDAIAVGAKAVWMQLGVVNEEAAARARAAGLLVVMDQCIMVEHMRLTGADSTL